VQPSAAPAQLLSVEQPTLHLLDVTQVDPLQKPHPSVYEDFTFEHVNIRVKELSFVDRLTLPEAPLQMFKSLKQFQPHPPPDLLP